MQLLLPGMLFVGLVGAEAPVREEQFVYRIVAFNGRDYSGTFTAGDSDTIYLLAGHDSFITARKTLVYFWPITGEWRTDAQNLDRRIEGELELEDNSGARWNLVSERYTYYNVRGEYDLNWVVATGRQADAARQRFDEYANRYRQQLNRYREASREFERRSREMRERIAALRAEGADVSGLIDELASMEAPQAPAQPREYLVPPAPIEEAFVVNLPPGEYRVRTRYDVGADQALVEGSEKRIVVFEPRRTDHIGLDVVPGDRWTRPEQSSTPSSVIYVNGQSDLYLRPFFQSEFNDLYYEKLHRNDARGNPGLMQWAQLQQVPRARIEVGRGDGSSETVTEAPYLVQQLGGGTPGYTILPYEADGAHAERDPSLRAFHIVIDPQDSLIQLQVTDADGQSLSGGTRSIRVVTGSRFNRVLPALALFPLVPMVLVKLRRRRYREPQE